jgi:hypothetical protein
MLSIPVCFERELLFFEIGMKRHRFFTQVQLATF